MQQKSGTRESSISRHKGGVEKVVLRPRVRLRGVLYLSLRLANATVEEPRTTSVHVHRFPWMFMACGKRLARFPARTALEPSANEAPRLQPLLVVRKLGRFKPFDTVHAAEPAFYLDSSLLRARQASTQPVGKTSPQNAMLALYVLPCLVLCELCGSSSSFRVSISHPCHSGSCRTFSSAHVLNLAHSFLLVYCALLFNFSSVPTCQRRRLQPRRRPKSNCKLRLDMKRSSGVLNLASC